MESLSFPSETSLMLMPSIVMVPSRIGSILLEKRIAVLLLELEWTTIKLILFTNVDLKFQNKKRLII